MKILGFHILTENMLDNIKFQARIEGRNEEMRITDNQVKRLVRQAHELKHKAKVDNHGRT